MSLIKARMKYQKLENLECGWKWKYLVRKHHEGVDITKYAEKDLERLCIEDLFQIEHQPEKIQIWLNEHLNPELDIRLKQAIRAKRKRYFNAEQQHLRKKSIDLEFMVWQQLSTFAKKHGCTLSDAIILLLDNRKDETVYVTQLRAIKADLQKLLEE